RAETVVRRARAEQFLGVGLIQVQPLGLPVRPVSAAPVRTLLPVETQPLEVPANPDFGCLRRSLLVGVLDTGNERAAGSAREQPVEERRACVADVQMAGRARRKPYSHGDGAGCWVLQVPGTRHEAPGTRCRVPRASCLVPGAGCRVPGGWYPVI